MWIEKGNTRLPQESWHPVPATAACTPQCPLDGHRVRLEFPSDFDSVQHAESRVRVLHEVYRLRNAWLPLGVSLNLSVLLHKVATFGRVVDIRAVDGVTWAQLHELEWLISATLARRMVGVYNEAREVNYSIGLETGKRLQKEPKPQF